MRNIEKGGGAMEERYIRELDPKEEDPGIEIVANFIQEVFPNAKVRDIKDRDQKPVHNKADRVIYFDNKPSAALKVTSELKEGPRRRLREEMLKEAFVSTPLSDVDLPRVLVYFDPTMENTKQQLQILESIRLSLTYDLGKTSLKPEQEQIQKMIIDIEAKQKEIQNKKSGKPTMQVH